MTNLFNTPQWDMQLFGTNESAQNFTILDDEVTVLYTAEDIGPPLNNFSGRRTWRTGAPVLANAGFDFFNFPQIGQSHLFPFEE